MMFLTRNIILIFNNRSSSIAHAFFSPKAEGLDGAPDQKYLRLVQDCKNNFRRVLQRIEAGDPVAARILQEVLDALPVGTRVRARLNPADVGPVGDLLRAEIDTGKVELDTDPSITRGGCVVESTVDVGSEEPQECGGSDIEGQAVFFVHWSCYASFLGIRI